MNFHSFEMRGNGARRMRFAILVSLAFHLLLLWPGLPRLPDREAMLLQATLRAPTPVSTATAPSPKPPAVAPAPSAGDTASGPAGGITMAARQSAPAAKPPDPPQPVPVPEAPALASAPPVVSTPLPLPVPASSPAVASAAPASGSPSGVLLTQSNASGEALDGLRGYRLSVAGAARRFKRYPSQALAAGWAGTAEVRLEVGGDGRPRAATVGRSSGHESLDHAALFMIDAGAQRARLPESLRGKAFAVVLPVVFNVDDE